MKNKVYQAEDIFRYLQGKMDRVEARELELAALDDELLADAIEGYSMALESHTAPAITSKIPNLPADNKKTRTSKVVGLNWYKWVGYAAAATVVIGGGLWIMNLGKPEMTLPAEIRQEQAAPAADMPSTPEEENLSNTQISEPAVAKAIENTKGKSAPATKNVEKPAPAAKATDAGESHLADAEMPPSLQKQNATVSESPARRIAPSTLQAEVVTTWRFLPTDTLLASPAQGWPWFERYLKESMANMAYKGPGSATLIIDANGKTMRAEIVGDLNDLEKQQLKKIFMDAPSWKNKAKHPTQVIIRW